MPRKTSALRFHLWNGLIAMILLPPAHYAMAQSAPPNSPPDAVTVHISANGSCQFLNESVPCAKLGEHLLKKQWAPNAHVHLVVDRDAKYTLVAATLQSLQGTGFKVGYVNNELW